jgi:hypothetical protein
MPLEAVKQRASDLNASDEHATSQALLPLILRAAARRFLVLQEIYQSAGGSAAMLL